MLGHPNHIGFSGTREGLSPAQAPTLWCLLRDLAGADMWLHHGCCIGADSEAHEMARAYGFWIQGHPGAAGLCRAHLACDRILKPAGNLERNRSIVYFTSRLIACPLKWPERQSGTSYTIHYALRLRRPVTIIARDGTTTIPSIIPATEALTQ